MKRVLNRALVTAAFGSALFALPAHAAVTQVARDTWGASGVPSYVNMYIYVPTKLAAKPPIVVACHSCGTAVSGYVNSIKGIQAAADKNGFIIILPEATSRNCWDVGSPKAFKRDGGNDAQAITQMVKYALTKYSGDPKRVYVMGGSSGAMMTQALAAIYPDVFRAASERAGVPAGCWADGYDESQQWSNNCAGGKTTKTAMAWGDFVRTINPDFKGHRPRMQMYHGTADTTISYNNYAEGIKEWTNVLGLADKADSTDAKMTSVSNYDRQFWKNSCGTVVLEAWAGKNGTHSMAYEEDAILAWFGLDKMSEVDPETDCTPGQTPVGSAAASGSAGPATSVTGSSSVSAKPATTTTMSSAAASATQSGAPIVPGGGSTANVNPASSIATPGSATGTGAAAASAGGMGGTTPTASATSAGAAASAVGTSSAAASASMPDDGSYSVAHESGGCGNIAGSKPSKAAYAALLTFGFALLKRRRRAQ